MTRLANIDTLSALIDRLITENIKLFFFEKNGELDKAEHQRDMVQELKYKFSELFRETLQSDYEYKGERRSFDASDFTDDIIALVMDNVRIGEADRARLEEVRQRCWGSYRCNWSSHVSLHKVMGMEKEE